MESLFESNRMKPVATHPVDSEIARILSDEDDENAHHFVSMSKPEKTSKPAVRWEGTPSKEDTLPDGTGQSLTKDHTLVV